MPTLAQVNQTKGKESKPKLFKRLASSYFFTKTPQDLPKSYFYTAKSGINPLIASAQPLLSIISRIKQSPNLKLLSNLKRSILHELQVYEKHSLQQGINMEQVLVGRYCLSAMLDEVMLDSALKKEWQALCLLPNQAGQVQPKEQFFKLLDKLLLKPEQNIVCLELVYILLSLGYEGKYKHYPHKIQHINQMIDNLYEAIRLYRGCYQTKLLVEQGSGVQQKKKSKWMTRTMLIGCLILSLVFIGFSYVLDVSAGFVVRELNHIVDWLT